MARSDELLPREPPPDGPGHLGSPAWLEATNGVIGQRRVRVGLLLRGLPEGLGYFPYRARAIWWRHRRESKGDITAAWSDVPTSPFADRAAAACRNLLGESPAMVNHSYRTFQFANALARHDRVSLDEDLLFAAAMLHDVGLDCPEYGVCFTRLGSRMALELGEASDSDVRGAAIAASAVSHHITPGLRTRMGGPHALYIQRGSLLDLTGTRAIHLPRDFVQEVFEEYHPLGVRREGGARWRAEAAMVCHGRAHLLQRYGKLSWTVRISPLPPKQLPPVGSAGRS